MKKPFSLYSLITIGTDITAYYMSLFLAYKLRVLAEHLSFVGILEFSLEHFLGLWWIPVTFIFFQIGSGLYWRRNPFWMESGKILRSLFLSFLVAFSFVSLGQLSASVSRLMLCFLFTILFPCILFLRGTVKYFLFKIPAFQEKALLVGDVKRLKSICTAFENTPYMGIRIAAQLSADKEITNTGINRIIKEKNISTAILAAPSDYSKQTENLFKYIHTKVWNVIYVPVPGAMDMTNADTGQLLQSQMGYLSVNRALAVSHNRVFKRLFDLFLATLILLPVLLITGGLIIAIRQTSKGTGLFRQERIGRNGKAFKVYKLRTMYHDAEKRLEEMLAADPALREEWVREYKLKNDPRITPLGKFLRKSSLDELPQVFNVLKGEMSMVGPRPVLQAELDKYYRENAVYYKMASPGITGLWQVSGRSDTSYDERISMDNWYICNWSLWLDIVILLSTPLIVIFRRGAY